LIIFYFVILVTDMPGFIDPNSGVINNTPRFSQQNDDYYNPNQANSDPNVPGKELEMIRLEGLSNGIVMVNNKRTANFETGEFTEMFKELSKQD
jgi:hypothetical protein